MSSCEDLSVYEGEEDVGGDEEKKFPVDEFVQGTLPFEEESGESTSRGGSHIALVGDGHGRAEGKEEASKKRWVFQKTGDVFTGRLGSSLDCVRGGVEGRGV